VIAQANGASGKHDEKDDGPSDTDEIADPEAVGVYFLIILDYFIYYFI
jgi:hypothetical protein